MELGPYNINVNTVCPGNIWTPMEELVAFRMGRANPDLKGLFRREIFDKVFLARIPLGREQTAEDIGNADAFFVSEDARNITGQALNVDGGRQMN